MQMTRRQDWPERLAEQIAAAQRQPYVIGVHDCARFSCQCIEAMTGIDLWPQLAGYKTERGAIKAMAKHGATLQAAATKLVGAQPTSPLSAKRGDLLIYTDNGGDHLGVCTGSHAAVLGPDGLAMLRLDHPGLSCCVRVG
jgi:cell wall-associated NlpC family hydrolase